MATSPGGSCQRKVKTLASNGITLANPKAGWQAKKEEPINGKLVIIFWYTYPKVLLSLLKPVFALVGYPLGLSFSHFVLQL